MTKYQSNLETNVKCISPKGLLRPSFARAKSKPKYEKDPSSIKSKNKNSSQPNLKDNVGLFGSAKKKITKKILIHMIRMILGRSRTSKYVGYNGLDKDRRKTCRTLLGTYIAEKILGRQRRTCNDNMHLDLRETGCENGK